jgi:post-segregation antitoxin (ccd killing protein)
MVRRMPRMQVYLPDDLHRRVKEQQLPVSELLQDAVRRELSRRERLAALDGYLNELAAELDEPTEQDREYVEQLMAQIRDAGETRSAG